MEAISTPDRIDLSLASGDGAIPKRIALFTGAYNHIADGVSRTLNRLVGYLEQHDVEVRVFAPTIDNPPVDHKGTLISVSSMAMPGRPEYRVSGGISRSVLAEIEAFNPTLFHIATPDVLGFQALRLAKKRGTPIVASYHTHFSSYLKYYGLNFAESFLWKYLRWFYDQCEHVYVPSKSMAAVLRMHGIEKGVRLWQRGVETSLFNSSRRSMAWRQSLGIQDDEVVLAYIGRLVWEKGLHIVADVIEALERRGVPHRSLIVGDGPIFTELQERLTNTVFTGYLEGEALAQSYASSDIFFFPSETETFGNVTLEAMASGLPAVCADATGSRSLVDPGNTGFLVQPGDTKAFLERTERLLTDDLLREQMGQKALLRAQAYDWSAILARINGYYDEVLAPDLSVVVPNLTPPSADIQGATSRPVRSAKVPVTN